ncbi:hypothetical protein CFI03_001640 [Paenibacillus sp. ATY16]|nr:hypothetical protein [Paenibacillus sp. ATY16]
MDKHPKMVPENLFPSLKYEVRGWREAGVNGSAAHRMAATRSCCAVVES